MANAQTTKVISIALIILGIGLLVWGFQMSDSVGSEVTEALTGSSPDAVMYRYIGGAISLAVGLYLLVKRS